jgi:hypothetical protein
MLIVKSLGSTNKGEHMYIYVYIYVCIHKCTGMYEYALLCAYIYMYIRAPTTLKSEDLIQTNKKQIQGIKQLLNIP